MKKKFLLLATTLLISSVCLYGCGEDKNNIDTVVEQTEVVEVQDQAENEDVASTGDSASKNYEYNHVFDDIINEAPIIDTDFLQMTSSEQVMAKYGEAELISNNKKVKYYYDGERFVVLAACENLEELNEYSFDRVGPEYFVEHSQYNISENFTSDTCDYLTIIEGDVFKSIGYPKGSNGESLVLEHTYSELVEMFENKGMLFRLDCNKITVAWCYKNPENDSIEFTTLSFDPISQKCIEIGY